MKTDKQLLVFTHLSQLLNAITGFGRLIVPLIIWFTKKEDDFQIDAQGKKIINFQLSLILNFIICIPLILLFGLGFLGFVVLAIISVLFPIINAIKASNGEDTSYPLSYNFIN